MDTQIWLQLDGRRQGPFTPEELRAIPFMPDTPVWYQGLQDWTMAMNAPLTAQILNERMASDTQQPQSPVHRSESTCEPMPPCPKTYMVWSILSTICCCTIFGIVAIIYSSQVSSRYLRGDYEGAVRASERAQLWIILAFVLGLVSAPLYYVYYGIGSIL